MKRQIWFLFGFIVLTWSLASCAPGAPAEMPVEEPTGVVVEEPETEEEVSEEGKPTDLPTAIPSATTAVQPTAAAATPSLSPTQLPASPTPLVESRMVEVEWPGRLHLGDSDVVRLSLVPSADGYLLTTEFPDHQTITQDVPVIRPSGYDLYAAARLDGAGFVIVPAAEQASLLPLHQVVTWHWSLTPQQPGRQRLTIRLLLRWEPLPGTPGTSREAVVYSKGLEVGVVSFFGLTRGQALTTALIGLSLGGVMLILGAANRASWGQALRSKPSKDRVRGTSSLTRTPNEVLEIECPAGILLLGEEEGLLRSIFQRYQRLVIKQEFLSGYSGARTFLLLPLRPDGRADAPTIAKLGDRKSIEQEYANYEAFVKHTLPPVTARIQAPPVCVSQNSQWAGLQYTFIAQPGAGPRSLRQALLENPDTALLKRLFETFGPNWWMQRKPWTFWLAQEYDRLLPPHWTLEPTTGRGKTLDGRAPAAQAHLRIGQLVSLRNFQPEEPALSGHPHLTLRGEPTHGQPALRLRWLGTNLPRRPVGRVVAGRMDLLRALTAGFDRIGLPDPLEKLPAFLGETVNGTQSTIHGDLNLENVLVGPGGLVWLIDFATTREGHPLMDFAHLEAEIIAHVIATQIDNAGRYLAILHASLSGEHTPDHPGSQSLLTALHEIAEACLGNPTQPREYELALYLSCLGALKYRNLDSHQKHFLYLTASLLAQRF
jgi:hypothetical protein